MCKVYILTKRVLRSRLHVYEYAILDYIKLKVPDRVSLPSLSKVNSDKKNIQCTIISDDEGVSYTPKRSRRSRRRRKRSSSSSSSSASERRQRKKNRTDLTAENFMSILTLLQNAPSKSIAANNNVVPEFDPDNRSQDVERWLTKVNECAVIYSWDEKQVIHYALQKLRGLAKSWYESLPSLNYSWDEWQCKLKKAFPNDVNYGKLLDDMQSRKSRTDEPLRDYFYDKLSWLCRCEIFGRKAVDCIIYGITDSSIRNGAQALKCEEPEDLLNYLASQQPTQFRETMRSQLGANTSRRRDFRPSTFSKNPVVSKNNDITCFNCNERGHFFQNCSKPLLKCTKCRRIGHNLENCLKKPLQMREIESSNPQIPEKKVLKVVTRDEVGLTRVVEKKHSGDCNSIKENYNRSTSLPSDIPSDPNCKFNKKICVNGTLLDSYIDFGSDCSLIKASHASLLGLTGDAGQPLPTIKGFGNATVVPRFRSTVHVRIDEIETMLDVLVVDDAYLHVPLLIGQNFTEMTSVTVMKDNERLIFYNTPADVFDKGGQALNLYVTKGVQVIKGGLVEVYSKESFTGDVYSEGGTRLNPNQEYYLHQGCYNIKDGKAVIFITPFSSAPLSLKAHSLIARVSPVKEVKTLIAHADHNSTVRPPLDKSDIIVGEWAHADLREKLYQLLQKYRSCFATNLSELGCARGSVMDIAVHDNTPVVYRPYRLSHCERQKVRAMVDELIDNDIVQESSSNYASPILLVKKKNGESRLCVDYRCLNSKTIKDKYPLPLIDDQLSNLSGNKYFITLDLASGYYQIPMGEGSRHLTAFVTPDGHYEFKRMPFGLANAPAIFQKMMNQILGSRRFKSALAYMDDLLIPSASIEEGFQRLEDVLIILQEAGLTLKLSKCSFFDTSIEYLGYEISCEGIKPSQRKISAVQNFPVPRNVHEVRQFLGLASYFRRFVKGFGEIARPLTTLLKKDAQWQWSNEAFQSFETLKRCLIERPLLALYNPELDTEVHTDASSLGLGGILMQWQVSPRALKPVAYFSRQTSPEERHFHSYELETLAVVCSLKKFRSYLLGLKFTVYTDCNALRTTLTKRDLIPRIARWWLLISEYDFNIEYRPGCRMNHVDALSRNPQKQSHVTTVASVLSISTDSWILTLQMADPELERIFKILKPSQDAQLSEIKKNFVIKNHSLHRKVGDELRLVVPKDARWQVCRANHDDVGHFGIAKTLERVQSRYWFPKLRRFVKKYVSACIDCAYNKDSAAKVRAGYLHPINKVEQPFHTLHLDHLGPFVRSKTGNCYILTIVDGFTKYVFARPVKDTKTKNVVKVLDSLFSDFSVPSRIISDRGTAFTSAKFKEFCVGTGVRHVLNAVACPRANGQAERFNQTILTALSTQNSGKDDRDWDKQLGKIQWGINNTINATTKKSAAELLFGIKFNGPIDNKLATENVDTLTSKVAGNDDSGIEPPSLTSPIRDSENRDLVNNATDASCTGDINKQSKSLLKDPVRILDELRKEASDNIKNSQKRQKQLYDSKRSPAVVYSVGDLVKITKTSFKNDGKSKKLLPKFIGPYKVIECLGNDRYKIANVAGLDSKKYESVVASDRMRHWIHVQALEVNRSSGSDSTSATSDLDSDSDYN